MSPDINLDCLVKEFINLGASNSTQNPPPPTDPLLGLTIYTVAAVAAVAAGTTTRMDDMNERVDDDDPPCDASEGDGFLNEIWDCPYFNENVKIPDPLNEGKTVIRWTCGWCPAPARGAPNNFFRHNNAFKALRHVLKIPDHGIRICLGVIPHGKKVAYKALYNTKMLRKKERERKKTEMDDQIDSYQDRLVNTHFPPTGNAGAM